MCAIFWQHIHRWRENASPCDSDAYVKMHAQCCACVVWNVGGIFFADYAMAELCLYVRSIAILDHFYRGWHNRCRSSCCMFAHLMFPHKGRVSLVNLRALLLPPTPFVAKVVIVFVFIVASIAAHHHFAAISVTVAIFIDIVVVVKANAWQLRT